MAQQILRDGLEELKREQPEVTTAEQLPVGETLANRFAGRLGVVSGQGMVSARDTGTQFTEIRLEKRWQGKI